MAFAVEDFHDLVRLLELHPQWRAELRRQVLSEELLELPALVRRLAEAQERGEQRLERVEATVGRLAEAQERTEARLAELAEAQSRTDGRLERLEVALERLAQAQLSTEERLLALIGRFDEHERRNALDFQGLKDGQLVGQLSANPRLLRPLIEQPRLLGSDEIEALVDGLLAQGRLQAAEAQDVSQVDLLARGQREGEEGYLVVEASWTVGLKDIERADRRAGLLEQAGVRARPAVVGYRVSEDAQQRLLSLDVLSLLLPE